MWVVSTISAEGQEHSPGQSTVAAAFSKLCKHRRVSVLLGCCSTTCGPKN